MEYNSVFVPAAFLLLLFVFQSSYPHLTMKRQIQLLTRVIVRVAFPNDKHLLDYIHKIEYVENLNAKVLKLRQNGIEVREKMSQVVDEINASKSRIKINVAEIRYLQSVLSESAHAMKKSKCSLEQSFHIRRQILKSHE